MTNGKNNILRSSKKGFGKIYRTLVFPGEKAIFLHKLTAALYRIKMKHAASLVSQISRFLTGIEIEPGVVISDKAIFSHGMGTVIGFSSIVGANVVIRHGVTLGAGNFRPMDGQRIHPKIEDFCSIGAGAVILGPITIGHHSVIGANSVVTKDVAPYSVMAGAPAKLIRSVENPDGMPWEF
ncbi:serine O-acetyltransferase EpsC [Stenotrophomonas sp. MMGLT7]|uniref:serine O-acetyltransferase EpsC n=1 Tax=Stenotrophomonas sp. MMGLT7 TaxID=2901227 RepID=UPI001E4900EF|nr:serine O-acetyltransferase EpsC [Stenotrophomonas sp. MMGLT7]MCD7099314.1 serine O-acetyltransferase [Stenotrophomonas sp. MMGLT7]